MARLRPPARSRLPARLLLPRLQAGRRGGAETTRSNIAVVAIADRRKEQASRDGRPAGLCRARPRHQQLPPAGRGAGAAGPVPRRRCLFAHRAAGRGAVRPPAVCRRPAMDRAVEALKICGDKLAQPLDPARAADRDRSLPLGREWRRIPRRASKTEAGLEAGDHRPPDRGAAGRLRLRLAGRARHRRRRPVRHRRRLVRDRADRHFGAPLAAPCQPHRVVDLAAGRRRLAGRALWRPRCHAGKLCGHGRRCGRPAGRASRAATASII